MLVGGKERVAPNAEPEPEPKAVVPDSPAKVKQHGAFLIFYENRSGGADGRPQWYRLPLDARWCRSSATYVI